MRTDAGAHVEADGQLKLLLSKSKAPSDASERPQGQHHRVVGLFAGIGGIELGLTKAGHETVLFCENDPAATVVLRSRFPEIALHDDVRSLQELPSSTSLVTGGFPCQDLSQAGATKGIAGARSGLVGEVFRLLERHDVPWLLLENVPFMLQLGRGEAMNVITTALEELGYRWAYRVVDSRAFGLPQRRRRVYMIASRTGDPRPVLFADDAKGSAVAPLDENRVACGFYWTEGLRGLGWATDAVPTLKGGSGLGIPSPPAILLPDGSVITPDVRDAERLQGFRANWTKPAELAGKKGNRWKLIGNAVSVPAAQWLGQRLAKPGVLIDFEVYPLRRSGSWPTAAWNVGEGRMAVDASEWPVLRPHRSLESFLRYPPAPLSAKATRGFLHRAGQAKLRFPSGLLEALRSHLSSLSVDAAEGIRPKQGRCYLAEENAG